MNDSKFLLFWVLVWDPIVSAIFICFMLFLVLFGNLQIAAGIFLVFVYVVFAPALYWVFFRKGPES